MPVGATESITHIVSSVSADIFGLLGLLLLFVVLGLSRGKDTLISYIFSLYPSALMTAHFPFYDRITFLDVEAVPSLPMLTVFVLSLIGTMCIITKYVDARYQEHAFWRYVEIGALATGAVTLTISVLYNIIELQYLYHLSPMIDTVLASKTYFFFWIIAPLVSILAFVRP